LHQTVSAELTNLQSSCCVFSGEYLMALPQQLEVLMGDESAAAGGSSSQEAAALQAEAAEGDELAAEWLDRVSHAAQGLGFLV
jgi:predicted NBD/HSP70 family sugar kinase